MYGYALSGGTYTTIHPFGSPGAQANDISNAGQIVGWYCANSACQQAGFLLSGIGGTFTSITVPGANDTYAAGVSDLGDVVGYYGNSTSGPFQSFIWSAGTFDFISDPLGAEGTVATRINDAGEIVGYYVDAQGVDHGFVATASGVPEPSSILVLLSGLGILVLLLHHGSRHIGATPARGALQTTVIFLAALFASQTPALCATFLQATGAPGLILVNQANGVITFCPASISVNVPNAKCAGIGTLPVASLSGNAFINFSSGSPVAFVGNIATGYVVQCALTWDVNSGKPTGSCLTLSHQ